MTPKERGTVMNSIIRARAMRLGITLQDALKEAGIPPASYASRRNNARITFEDMNRLNRTLYFTDADFVALGRAAVGNPIKPNEEAGK